MAKMMHDVQTEVAFWMSDTFTPDVINNRQVRALRFLEEALELTQALDLSPHDATRILAHVYSRPKERQVAKGVGGVIITLAALCNSVDVQMDGAYSADLIRCWQDKDAIAARQAGKIFPTDQPPKEPI